MKNLFRNLFRAKKRQPIRRARPILEALEDRLVPTAYLLEDGTLNVIGTSQSDRITVEEISVFSGYACYPSPWGYYCVPQYENQIQTTIEDLSGNIIEQEQFDSDDVDRLNIRGQSGSDIIDNQTHKPSEIDGENGNDTIYGGYADDVIRGGNGNDTVYGRDGDDEIHFDEIYNDNDYANGGRDDDTYFVDQRPYTSITGHTMRITDWYGSNTLDFSDYNVGVDVELWNTAVQEVAYNLDLDLGGSTNIKNLIGTSSHDTLTGNALDNVIEGLGGNDNLEGMQGDDTLRGGSGSDTYRFWTDASRGSQYSNTMNLGDDRVEDNATNSLDTLNFIFFTRSGVDIDLQTTATQSVGTGLTIDLSSTVAIRDVEGSAQSDTILGNTLNNTLNGWEGNDVMRGRNGSDTISGSDGDDTISGGNGRDFLFGGNDNDTMYSDESWGDDDGENDTVQGGNGDDTVYDDGWWIWWD